METSRAARFGRAIALPLHERVTRWNSFFDTDLESLVGGPPVDRLQHLRGVMEGMTGRSPLSQLLLANFSSYLPDDLLVKADRCTMANSLEARAPFLDTALMEYVAGLPDSMKLSGGRTKIILREAFDDIIPPAIQRRPKMGFGVPVGDWIRGPLREWAEGLLDGARIRREGFLDAARVTDMWRAHLAGHSECHSGHTRCGRDRKLHSVREDDAAAASNLA